ncbi:MAG TPA: nuclear transport factor 2 family protein [Gemmatimonadales bacterium]|nr:nuclear transport factor 2 family protein [Gemmatimonadales bacterium]
MVTSMTTEATRALGRELIDTFGKGWQKGNVDLQLSIFSETAVFIETPFAEPIEGLQGIRGYWGDIPAHQAEITFNSGEIFSVGPWFSTEFKVTYRRRRTGEWVEAKGALFCETDGEKVTEMRMYWHRR